MSEKILQSLHETAYAEFGSALEMLCAAKQSESPNLCRGYFNHACDEYNHASTFFQLLSKRARDVDADKAKGYRFVSPALYTKGYVSDKGYLVEQLSNKNFVGFVYTNELLARSSFERLLKSLGGPGSEDGSQIASIMEDELSHHGLAKDYFLRRYSKRELRLIYLKESLANKTRRIYDANLKVLDIVFSPIFKALSWLAIPIIREIDPNVGHKSNDLLAKNPRSLL